MVKAEKSKDPGEHGVNTPETRGSPAPVSVCLYVCVFVRNTYSVSLLAGQRAAYFIG